MSYPDDSVGGSRIKMTGVGVIVVVTFVVHKTINWVFAGAKKKTSENRGPREPDL